MFCCNFFLSSVFNIKPFFLAGYPANETGYPAGYKKGRISGATLKSLPGTDHRISGFGFTYKNLFQLGFGITCRACVSMRTISLQLKSSNYARDFLQGRKKVSGTLEEIIMGIRSVGPGSLYWSIIRD